MSAAPRFRQQGVVLFIALIVLVAMSLAGIAMMRSVGTGALIANNLAFKQSATNSADWGIEAARTWLTNNSTGNTLYNDLPGVAGGNAYYSTWQSGVDLLGQDTSLTPYDWSTAVSVGTDAAGNSVKYVIQRMCDGSGDPAGLNCIKASAAAGGAVSSSGTKGAGGYGGGALSAPVNTFYRITVQVTGPRNTVGYVQVVVF
ncbi:MAG TPA: hypothetical protein VLX30_02145 [Burkholderiales bacterium]|nr:hypothetical protein [Burkholderiales bacterium]